MTSTIHSTVADVPTLKRLRARGVWEGSQRTRLTVRDFPDFATGEPEAVGGDNSAPTPMELVLAALDGCLVVVIETVATERRLALRSVEVESEAAIDTRGFAGVPGVRPHFAFVRTAVALGLDATPEGHDELAAAVEQRCPALNLIRDAEVEVELVWTVR